MNPDPSAETDDAWREVEVLTDEIFGLSRSDMPAEDFFRQLLDRTLATLGAAGGVVWLTDTDADLRIEYQVNFFAADGDTCPSEADHREAVALVLRSGEPQIRQLPAARIQEAATDDLVEFTLLAVPMTSGDEARGVIELLLRSTGPPETQKGNLQLLQMISNLAVDFLQLHELRQFQQLGTTWKCLDQFDRRVYSQVDVKATAYEVVNEGRRFVGCDRLSLAVYRRGHFAVAAISGVETIERRSNAIRTLERLAGAVAASQEPLWYDGVTNELAPQILDSVSAYVDQSHVRTVAAVPLRATRPQVPADRNGIVAILVAEQYDACFDESMRMRTEMVSRHASMATSNALEYASLPFQPLLRPLAALWRVPGRTLLGRVAIGAAVLLVAVVLLCLPADFDVLAEGVLQPAEMRDVFAPLDGEVVQVRVEHGDRVQADDVLLVLQSRELVLESQRIQAAYEATRKRLLAVEAARIQLEPKRQGANVESDHLTAEQEELEQQLASQLQQLDVLDQMRQQLEVRAPIAGHVLTWDLSRLLANRPVLRGQVLLTIGEVEGPWVAELQIPEPRSGYVLSTIDEGGPPVEIAITPMADRSEVYAGRVERVAARAEFGEDGRTGVKIRASIAQEGTPKFKPGSTVQAKIHCGRRPVFYVWFAEFIEHFRGWLAF